MRTFIENYENIYEIDDLGNVFSLERLVKGRYGPKKVKEKKIKSIVNVSTGYSVVNLSKEGIAKQHRVHILVAKAFLANPFNKETVNHINGNKQDNSKNNLEWATPQEQMTHASLNGLTASGMRNGGNKISDQEVEAAFNSCMTGAELGAEATKLNVNRNTLTKAFYRLGYEEVWKKEAKRRKSNAALKRWKTSE